MMIIFKDRVDAGKKLADLIVHSYFFKKLKQKKDLVIVSLLRGGVVVGHQIALELNIKNLPLSVVKISSPENNELAIGAVCFSEVYWKKEVLNSQSFSDAEKKYQFEKAKEKFFFYCQRFKIEEKGFEQLKDKVVVLVDDGIATGATTCASFYFLKTKKPKTIVLASPVAPFDFKNPGFDQVFFYHQEKDFSAISQFYEDFSSVEIDKIQ